MKDEIAIDDLANDKFGDRLNIEQSMAEPSIDQLADYQFPVTQAPVSTPVVQTVPTGIQQSEVPPTSIDPRLNKAIDTFYGDNAPTAFEKGVHQTFADSGEKLKGLVWQDGQPSTSEFSKGVSQFAMAMPGFILGAGLGIDKSSKEMQRQVWNKDVPFNLEQVADEFAKGLHEGSQYFQPTVEMLSGVPTPSSNLVGEVAMAPLNAIVASGEKLAAQPIFRDSPNIRGAIKIVASATGLLVNGRMMHSGAPDPSNMVSKIAEEAKPLVEEATGIAKAFDSISEEIAKVDINDPNAVAEAKILAIKKTQLEVKKKAIDDALGKMLEKNGEHLITTEDELSARDALNKGRLVPTARTEFKRPSKAEVKKVTKQLLSKEENDLVDKVVSGKQMDSKDLQLYDNSKKVIEDELLARKNKVDEIPPIPTEDVPFETIADEKMKVEVESVAPVEEVVPVVPKGKRSKIIRPTEEAIPKPVVELPPEPILPIDEKVGIEAESNVSASSPFRTSPEKTEIHKNSYAQREAEGTLKDPVTMHAKLINDVNRWLDGDDSIDIDMTRRMLTRFSTDVERHPQLRDLDEGTKRDFSDAATWARRTDRLKIEPSIEEPQVRSKIKPSGGVQLNSMIPLDKIPDVIKAWFGRPENKGSNIRRNKKLWDELGYVWNNDVRKFTREHANNQTELIPEGVDAIKILDSPIPLTRLIKDKNLFDLVPGLKDFRIESWEYKGSAFDQDRNLLSLDQRLFNDPVKMKAKVLHEIDHTIGKMLGGSRGSSPGKFIREQAEQQISNVLPFIKDPELFKEIHDIVAEGYNSSTMKELVRDVIVKNSDKVSSLEQALKPLDNPIDYVKAGEDYLTTTGEMQSRVVEARAEMTDEQLRTEPPWDTLERILKQRDLPVSSVTKLYSDPFFIQAMIDTAKRAFKTDKFGKEKIDLKEIPEGKVKEGIKKGLGYMKAVQKDIEASERNASTTLKEAYDLTAEALWNTKTRARRLLRAAQHDPRLADAAKSAEQKMINEAGGHAYGQIMFEQFRKEVYGGLNKVEKHIVNALVRGKRVIDIATYKPDTKFPLNQGFEDAIYYEANFEGLHGLTKERASELLRRRDAYFEHMKDLVDVRLEGGLIDQVMADGLKSHDYSKFKGIGERLTKPDGTEVDTFSVERLFDEKNNVRLGGKVQSVNASGIDSLARGKKTDILEINQQITALEMYNRVYGAVAKNRTFQDLAEIARLREDNGFIKLGKKETKLAREAREAEGIEVDKLPNIDQRGWVKHNFWEGGKKKAIYLRGDFAEGLGSAGRDLSPHLAALLSVASMSYVPKLMATGVSSLWSTFVNFPIDQLNVLLSNGIYEGGVRKRLYSTNPVVYSFQMGRDLGATFYDTFFRAHDTMNRTQYMRTAERGMQMPFMATQARLTRKGYKIPGAFSALQDVLGYHSTSMEMWTRQAIAERVIRRRASEQGLTIEEARADNKVMDEAVATARDYLDFSQGGWFTKSMDQAGWMYLNASIQATKSFGRALKEDPKGTMMAVTQTIGMPTVGITIAAVLLNSKTHKEIPEYQEENNMNIPLSDSFRFKDSQGNERGMYVSLPIGSTAGFIKNVFKAGTMKAMYETGMSTEKPDYKSIFGSLKQTAPDIISLPPSLRAVFQYANNIDLRTGQDITPKVFTGADRVHEYTPGETPQMAIDLGQRLGMSPDMLDMARKTLIGNNEYTSVLGYAYAKAFADVPKDMKDELFAVDMAKVPGFKRVFKLTKAGQERGDKQDEFVRENELERYIDRQNINFFAKALYWSDMKSARQSLSDYMRKPEILKDQARYERLNEQTNFIRDVRALPDRTSWLRLWHEPTSVKAKDYVDRMEMAKSPEEKEQLRKSFAIVMGAKGYVGEDFFTEVGKVKMDQLKKSQK